MITRASHESKENIEINVKNKYKVTIFVMKKLVVVHRGNSNNNKVLTFVSRCSHLGCMSRRFDCILLVFIGRRGRLVTRNLINHYVLCDWLVFNSCDCCISILAVPVSCSLSSPLFRTSPDRDSHWYTRKRFTATQQLYPYIALHSPT